MGYCRTAVRRAGSGRHSGILSPPFVRPHGRHPAAKSLQLPEHLADVAGQGADELQVFRVVVPICSGFAALAGDGEVSAAQTRRRIYQRGGQPCASEKQTPLFVSRDHRIKGDTAGFTVNETHSRVAAENVSGVANSSQKVFRLTNYGMVLHQ